VSGIQEILVVVFILLVILYLPKRTARNENETSKKSSTLLSGWLRLGILASFVWLAAVAGTVHILAENSILFLYFGAGPVALAWGVAWVVNGYRK